MSRKISCALLFLSLVSLSHGFPTQSLSVLTSSQQRSSLRLHYYQPKNDKKNSFSNNIHSFGSPNSYSENLVPSQSIPVKAPSTPPGKKSTLTRTNELMMEQQKKNKEITAQWEAEIKATSKDKLDRKMVDQWLEPKPEAEQKAKAAQRTVAQWNDGWRVALAAGTVIGLGCEYVTHSSIVSMAVFGFVFFSALRDPTAELNEENVAGPLARIIGRSAIESYEVTQPKIKAVARAAVRGDQDFAELKLEVEQLREENAKLRLYSERREWIDEHQSDFALEDLKILAQRFRITYSGIPKPVLMLRLLEAGALRMR